MTDEEWRYPVATRCDICAISSPVAAEEAAEEATAFTVAGFGFVGASEKASRALQQRIMTDRGAAAAVVRGVRTQLAAASLSLHGHHVLRVALRVADHADPGTRDLVDILTAQTVRWGQTCFGCRVLNEAMRSGLGRGILAEVLANAGHLAQHRWGVHCVKEAVWQIVRGKGAAETPAACNRRLAPLVPVLQDCCDTCATWPEKRTPSGASLRGLVDLLELCVELDVCGVADELLLAPFPARGANSRFLGFHPLLDQLTLWLLLRRGREQAKAAMGHTRRWPKLLADFQAGRRPASCGSRRSLAEQKAERRRRRERPVAGLLR